MKTGGDIKAYLSKQRVDVLFGVWALWGVLLMALAHTDIITQSWFQSFRFWVGQVVPTVNSPPVKEVIDPKVASSFLAMLWATSPLSWFVFRSLPDEKVFRLKGWMGAPSGGRVLLAVAVMGIAGVMAFGYDFESRRMGRWLYANWLGFTVIASWMALLPWYCLVSIAAWWKQFDLATKDVER